VNEAGPLEVEASGETVGEAKWIALRELEKLAPELDKSAVSFQVVSEGQRGLLGVGYAPARVIARVDPEAITQPPELALDESELAAEIRDVLERIAAEIVGRVRIDIVEDDDTLAASIQGGDLGLLIGKHGQTIDAIQYLVTAIAHRGGTEQPKTVIVDAAGYRERRRATIESLAVSSAERVLATGGPVELGPMTSIERKLVHERLKDLSGVVTRSEGMEPNRFVVIELAGD
jgi:spoIIIJ-associated protein